MTDYLALLMFPCLLFFILTGFPVAFVLAGVSLLFAFLGYELDVFYVDDLGFIPSRVFGVMSNITLMAVPLFVFMGLVLERSGIAEKLLETISRLLSRQSNSLPIAVVIVGAILAASTGIVGATVVTMGILSLPVMLRQGYSRSLAAGCIVASGTLGQIIPPSIVLVILADMMNLDVGDVFAAAIIPGLCLVGSYLLYLLIHDWWTSRLGRKKSGWGVESTSSSQPMPTMLEVTRSLGAPILLMSLVLGSILSGLASPTEAAACGVAGALLVSLPTGKINWSEILDISLRTARTSAMVFWLLIGAQFFGVVFRGLGGDILISDSIGGLEIAPSWIILATMFLLFLLGFFLDFLEICFIVIPIILPIMHHLEVDILWLSILIAINLQTSFLTPPFGFALFYLKGVAPPELKTIDIYRGVLPFVILQVGILLLIGIWPELATWLPRLMFASSE